MTGSHCSGASAGCAALAYLDGTSGPANDKHRNVRCYASKIPSNLPKYADSGVPEDNGTTGLASPMGFGENGLR